MAEFVEVIRQKERMCNSIANGCEGCQMDSISSACDMLCEEYLTCNPERAEKVIMDWAAEHPEKTLLNVFFERNPNAPLHPGNNTPYMCPDQIGLVDMPDECDWDCIKCWSRPYNQKG